MKVYKYRSNYDRDVISLSLNQLFAPTYENLNDPFEGMFNDKEDKKILEVLKSFDSNNLHKGYDDFVETIKIKGVYSLCKTFDNEILWSLYSDSHKGFVIEYDLDLLLKDFNFNKIIPLVHTVEVKYKESPQKSNILTDSYNKRMDLTSIIGTKSLSWKHEKEIRLIFEEQGINTYNFNAVTSIIFGLRASKKEITKVMNMLKGRGLKYYQMKTETDSYRLRLINLEDQFESASKYIQNSATYDEYSISTEYIHTDYHIYIDLLKKKVSDISSLPNILKIDTIEIYGEVNKPKLNIIATTSYGMLPVRFFEFQFLNGDFIQINI
ncbi:DUF2971 domain-containing protein [Chryseobacterium sp. VD8]|uniref:DUF2971 domain-containing protein n=1 Tax=Chryseobacterium sp. VD8 TaxID=3081254 RepID=UPI003018E290